MLPVLDNGVTAMTNNSLQSSDDGESLIIAENIIFSSNTTLTTVQWSGQYGGPAPSTDDFAIDIYADDAGPSGSPLVTFDVGNNVNRTQVVNAGSGEFDYSANIHFGLEAGTTYWMTIREQGATGSPFRWNRLINDVGTSAFSNNGGTSWTVSIGSLYDLTIFGGSGPTNDFFSGPPLSFPINTTATNVCASVEADEQQVVNTGSTVWWFFFAPDDGMVTLDTFGSNFDTQLHIYTGFAMGFPNLIPVANNDDSGSLQSQVTFPVEAGECYEVRVGGFRGSNPVFPGSEGDIVLNGSFESAPEVLLGDVNLDEEVNLLDIAPFVELITNGVFQPEADVNEDDAVNLLDVGPFVAILSGG